jgi:hypothetical protein
MSLSGRDRQALSSIEDELAESDPGLAELLGGFSTLMAGQDMPAVERGPAGWRRVVGGLARWLHCLTRPRHVGRLSWLPATLVLWLALVCTFVAVALAASHAHLHGACSTVRPARCAPYTPLLR